MTCSSAPGRRCSTPPCQPLDSASWLAAVTVALDRIGATGELGVLGRAGWDQFAAAVRAELGATRWYSTIVRAVFDAATDPAPPRSV